MAAMIPTSKTTTRLPNAQLRRENARGAVEYAGDDARDEILILLSDFSFRSMVEFMFMNLINLTVVLTL